MSIFWNGGKINVLGTYLPSIIMYIPWQSPFTSSSSAVHLSKDPASFIHKPYQQNSKCVQIITQDHRKQDLVLLSWLIWTEVKQIWRYKPVWRHLWASHALYVSCFVGTCAAANILYVHLKKRSILYLRICHLAERYRLGYPEMTIECFIKNTSFGGQV